MLTRTYTLRFVTPAVFDNGGTRQRRYRLAWPASAERFAGVAEPEHRN